MGYFIEKQEWCDKMSHHLCYDVSCNIIYYQSYHDIGITLIIPIF